MLHKFFEPGDWFRSKSHGYGSGLPIAWQGWVLMAVFTALIVGLALLAQTGGVTQVASAAILMALSTAIFLAIVRKRTRGGWRWRWGDPD